MTVVGLAEIVLWAHDLDRSLAFYRDLFGLEVISPPQVQNRFLKASAGVNGVPEMIVLVPHPEPEARFPAEKPRRSLHHLALNVDPDRYEALQEECRAQGLEVRFGTHPVLEGVRTFYVDDPDGNEVEVIAGGG
jgi:catechol 2,3-dioxygenase-like lactoylglutathione lyase family enzyme